MGKDCSRIGLGGRPHYRLERCFALVLLALLAGRISAAVASDSESDAPPLREIGLRAEHVVLQRGSDQLLEQSSITLSAHGIRIEHRYNGLAIFANYRDNELWLVDRWRRVRHQVPVTFVDTSADASPSHLAAATDSLLVQARTDLLDDGFMSDSACAGMRELGQFDASWRGRPVSISTCARVDGSPMVRHWFNDELGLVIRTMDTKGHINELRGIQSASFPDDHFIANSLFRSVDIREFLSGSESLAVFMSEVDDSRPASESRRDDSLISTGSMSQTTPQE